MDRIMVQFARALAVVLLLVCAKTRANAEEPQRTGAVVRAGVALGGGLVDWVGKDANGSVPGLEAAARPGFSAGLFAAIDVSKLLALGIEPIHISLQPELLYSDKGSKYVLDGEYRARNNMTYLQASLLIRTEYASAGRIAPYAVVGPELGFLHSVEFEDRFGDTNDATDDFKSIDFGFIAGLGAMYSLPPWGALGLELRADLGLVSIDGQGDGDEIRNAALTLLLAYLY